MTGPRRLLLGGLLAILVILVIKAQIGTIWLVPRPGVDLERPLLAAERWLEGGPVYDPAAFSAGPGLVQPFLYPPYTVPIFAALTPLPRQALLWGAVLAGLILTVAALRRLQIPWAWLPLVIAWPPFTEGILEANVQIPMFAAFVFLFYQAGGKDWVPVPRDIGDRTHAAGMLGVLSTFIGMFKISQPHPWLFVLRHRPKAAVAAAAALVLVAALTLAVTTLELWFEWFAQLRRASDPAWDLGGFALTRWLGPLAYPIAAACLVAVWFAPRKDPGPWVGVLSVVGSLSLHIFGLLFLVPAMLKLRREIVIVAAAFVATYAYVGSWAGVFVVFWCLLVLTFGSPSWRAAVKGPT